MGQVCTKGHPNIVVLVGYLDEPAPGIAMKKYMCSLHDILRNSANFPNLNLTPDQIAVWAREIASGIAEIHRQYVDNGVSESTANNLNTSNVVHLDMKPLNVLMDAKTDGLHCVISDFGVRAL